MAGATKVYEIADEVAITSNGVVLTEGTEVTADDFVSEEVFKNLVKAKKIIEVTKKNKSSSGGETQNEDSEKQDSEKNSEGASN